MAGSVTTRRAAVADALLLASPGASAAERLRFDDLYAGWSVTGLRFSDRAKTLAGQTATMAGFMAPPLRRRRTSSC